MQSSESSSGAESLAQEEAPNDRQTVETHQVEKTVKKIREEAARGWTDGKQGKPVPRRRSTKRSYFDYSEKWKSMENPEVLTVYVVTYVPKVHEKPWNH